MIDTGANVTVFNDAKYFTNLRPASAHSFIRFGPSGTFPIEGEGTVQFSITDLDSVPHSVFIKNVMYVPTQPHNIVCLKSLREMHSGMNFDQTPYHIRWRIQGTDQFQHVYFSEDIPHIRITPPLQVNTVRHVPANVNLQAYTHARLGHISASKIASLQHAGYLKNVDRFSTHPIDCEVCVRANAKLDPYPSRSDIRATHPNHTLHADLLDVPNAGQYRYLLLVLDEHTRYAFARLLKTKDKAAEALLCIMKRAHVLHNHNIKFLHTDQGGEFSSTVLKVATDELGIAPEVVPARCHQSNGLIERLNRTIQEKIRAFLIASCLPDTIWGEAALYATHVYNLTPHSALSSDSHSSPIPHALYMQESLDRMHRLYDQLLPFGIMCNVTDTHEHLKKLKPRSAPAVFVGTGTSTTQYRVCLLSDPKLSVHIVRHLEISPSQHDEILSRTVCPYGAHRQGNTTFTPTAVRQLTINTVTTPLLISDSSPPMEHSSFSPICNVCSTHHGSSAPGATIPERPPSPPRSKGLHTRNRRDGIRFRAQSPQPHDVPACLHDGNPACHSKDVAHSPLSANSGGPPKGRQTFQATSEAPSHRVRPGDFSASHRLFAHAPVPVPKPRAGPSISKFQSGKRLRRAPTIKNPDEPTLAEAMNSPDADSWIVAMHDEMQSLSTHGTYSVVERPRGVNVIKGKWVFKVKRNEFGEPERHKARFVAKGFAQQLHVHYEDVWAPTAHYSTLRILFNLALQLDFDIRHVDVKCAFLNGSLNEQIYVEQPEIINDGNPQHVWLLHKALYGLKQAGRQWHLHLKDVMLSLHYSRAGYDPALFVSSDGQTFVLMWVDDLFIFGRPESCDQFTTSILKHFDSRDLGEAKWLLGMAVTRDKAKGTLTLSHEQMITNMLQKYGLEHCKHASIPMEANQIVGPDPHTKSRTKLEALLQTLAPNSSEATTIQSKLDQMETDSRLLCDSDKQRYMQIVGSLQYVATVTRPDISFAASSLARFLSCPTAHLMKCAERVLRYLAGTKSNKLTYTKSDSMVLTGYSDADWANCEITRKSTSGIVIYCNNAPVHWRSKRQPIVTMSTTEAELVALTELSLQVKWLRNLLQEDIRIPFNVTPLFCDNASTVTLAKDPISSDRTKHIEVRFRKVQELVESKEVEVAWIPTDEQAADIFTKPLPRPAFMKFKQQLQVQDPSPRPKSKTQVQDPSIRRPSV
jgi:transposase InsO family protein